jgi:hypothetical protein
MAGYGTDEGFAAYAAANGYTVPTGTVAAARARGSAYIDGTYSLRFPGYPTGGIDQDREWPRTGASDRQGNAIAPDAVPLRVINASYEAALIELTTPGSLAVIVVGSQRVVREKVEGAVEVEYARPTSASSAVLDSTPVVTIIAGMLAPLLRQPEPYALVV